MAKILSTKGSAAALEDLIRRSERVIYLLSFSFLISEQFKSRIVAALLKGVEVNLVYGKSISREVVNELLQYPSFKIYFYKNLHAKFFANESKIIIGSMNFSEYSEINNTEIGVYLTKDSDSSAFSDAMVHCREIISSAILENPKPESKVLEQVVPTQDVNTSRYQFVINLLLENYGPISKADNHYIDLKRYSVSIYLNDERIDFVFRNEIEYRNNRELFKSHLKEKIKRKFWVNSSRVNISAVDNNDLAVAIKEVMSIVLLRKMK